MSTLLDGAAFEPSIKRSQGLVSHPRVQHLKWSFSSLQTNVVSDDPGVTLPTFQADFLRTTTFEKKTTFETLLTSKNSSSVPF